MEFRFEHPERHYQTSEENNMSSFANSDDISTMTSDRHMRQSKHEKAVPVIDCVVSKADQDPAKIEQYIEDQFLKTSYN
ncbi:hypothetical protein K7432_010110 [Basidiobolus ranarum]|uniref:Uncharacterized protein n=1 Tax=Basidiobolus ranarum TaxID=34480 RepID=A0ABR2VW00_9FUNG